MPENLIARLLGEQIDVQCPQTVDGPAQFPWKRLWNGKFHPENLLWCALRIDRCGGVEKAGLNTGRGELPSSFPQRCWPIAQGALGLDGSIAFSHIGAGNGGLPNLRSTVIGCRLQLGVASLQYLQQQGSESLGPNGWGSGKKGGRIWAAYHTVHFKC